MKTLFTNAKIYDGTGKDCFVGNVLVENDKIVAVGDVSDDEAKVVDLTGYSLASGFIDGHSHNDWFATKKNNLKYFEPFIRQGITTFVCGNCGLSATGYGQTEERNLSGGLFNFDNIFDKIPPHQRTRDTEILITAQGLHPVIYFRRDAHLPYGITLKPCFRTHSSPRSIRPNFYCLA